MDFDEKKRRQQIRVIIAEIGMVLSVIAIVVVSLLAAMGFMIGSNGNIEQSGLMQLHSLPTGASVRIDGVDLFPRTNLSRTLTAGEHHIELSRDGYDTWQKTVKINSGVLLRVYYPRLFLQNRVAENVKELSTNNNLEFYSASPNRNYLLYAEKGASDWQLIDIRGDEIKTTILDLSGILPGMLEEKDTSMSNAETKNQIETHKYKFHGQINEIIWSSNEENVLVKVAYETKSEWVLVRFKDIVHSVNLSRTYSLENAQISLIDNAANHLYVLEKNQLRRIDTADGVMSRVLLNNVMSFANKSTNIIYIAKNAEGKRTIGVYRDEDKGGTIVTEIPDEIKAAKVAISYYYGEDYLVYVLDNKAYILYGKIPSYDENATEITTLRPLVEEALTLANIPDDLITSPEGEYIIGYKGNQFSVIDLDAGDLSEYEALTTEPQWFDASMLYTIQKQEILVWDYDGTNLRNLAKSMQTTNGSAAIINASPVTVTTNNRWIYYLTQGDKFTNLTREKIRD